MIIREEHGDGRTVAGPTCAGDDDVHLSDDFVQFHQPEAVHAVIRMETVKIMRLKAMSTQVSEL